MKPLDLFSPLEPEPSPRTASKAGARKPKTALPPKVKQKRGRKPLNQTTALPGILQEWDRIPKEKNYYQISEVAEMFQVNASLIRFWANEFDILQPRKNGKGDRLFRPEDIQNLKLIYYLVRERKYTLEGARQKLKEERTKVQANFELVQTLTRIRGFLLQLKENI